MRTLLFLLTLCFAAPAAAQMPNAPWMALDDSIVTYSVGGEPRDLPWPIITQERAVMISSFGGPGAAMGSARLGSFNTSAVPASLDRACGFYTFCSGAIIQAGTNDYILGTPWADQRTAILRVLDWADQRSKRVLMLDLIFNRDAEVGTPTNSAGLTFAQIRNARYLECTARAPRCVFALRPANLSVLTPGFYQPDGTHLTPAGRRAYATWVESAASAAGLF